MHYDGISSQALAARLETPLLLCVDEVPSVLDLVHELAADGAKGGWVVLADTQTAGRGRRGRRWVSPRGAGIWLGYLFRPGRTLEGGVLSLRVGLTVVRALDALGVGVHIKWPNDILLSDRKLAGILCEARGSGQSCWVAVGIGMNVRGPVLPELEGVAVALDQHQHSASRVEVLEQLVPRLHRLSAQPTLDVTEHAELASHDWLRERKIIEPVSGKASGIDRDGALTVATANGIERVLAGTVEVV